MLRARPRINATPNAEKAYAAARNQRSIDSVIPGRALRGERRTSELPPEGNAPAPAFHQNIAMNDHPAHYNAAMEALIQRAKDPVTGRTVQSKMKVVAGTVNRGNPKRRVGKPKFGEQKTKAVALDVIDEGKTWDQVRAEHGVSATIIRTAVAKEEGRREALQEAYLDPQTLSRSAQEKLQAAIRQEQRRLEAEFERRVQDEIKKRLDELYCQHGLRNWRTLTGSLSPAKA
jgi:hypothetical protein